MNRIVEVGNIEELNSHRLLWNSLLSKTQGANFFQSFGWLNAYWRHFGSDQTLRVLIIYEDDKPVGILPLVVRSEQTLAGRVRVLTYPLHDWGTFYGPIGPDTIAILRAGLGHVRNTRRDWDMLDLRWINSENCDFNLTEQAMCDSGLHSNTQVWSETGIANMSGTWEEYWQNQNGRKWRRNVKRAERRLARQGNVTFIRHRPASEANGDGDPRWNLYDDCLKVARKSWQSSSKTGTTISHKSVEPFLRDTHKAASQYGSVDVNLLYLDREPIAFLYNYYYDGSIYGLRMGFDPAYAASAPGLVITKAAVEDCFTRKDRYYDFGVGSTRIKQRWVNMKATSYRYTHFPKTSAIAQVLRLKRWYVQRVHGKDYPTGCKARVRLVA